MARFKNEAKAAGRLLHPNIVSVYEYGEDNANAFIAMEFVDGHRAARISQPQATFDLEPDRRDRVAGARGARFRARARGRASRHQAGEPDPDGVGRGQGRRLRHRADRHFEPDQRRHGDGHAVVHVARAVPGQEIDRRSDIFSTGVVLYELLTGRNPSPARSRDDRVQDLLRGSKPPSAMSQMPVTAALDAIVVTALAKAPEARFQNARAFNQCAAAGARPRADLEEARRWMRPELNLAAA